MIEKDKKTLCIAGKNDIAVDVMLYCKEHFPEHRLVCLLNRNESGINSWQKSLKWFALKYQVEIVELDELYEIRDLVFLSCEFDRILIPDRFASQNIFNIHFSMLPAYKGCYPSVLPILHGEYHTGVTLHRVRSGIDTGEIIDQEEIHIGLKDSSLDLYRKLISTGTQVVIRNLDSLISGRYECRPQGKKNSSYFSAHTIDYSNLSLDVNKTAYQIHNQIRAFSFRPYQIISWNNERYIDSDITDSVSGRRPGTILDDSETYTVISTIDYDIIAYKDTFYKAIEAIGNGEDASRLCKSRKIIESKDDHGWSLLTVAVYTNNKQMAEWLLEAGSDICVINNNGTTLLMYAKNCYINTGDPTMFEMLMNKGIEIDRKDYSGYSLRDYCLKENIKSIGCFSV